MPNRLAGESSLYLRQHADNPVDWYPWGDTALERARREDKPIIVSVGYSACHWCHVMAHECFEDAYIAGLMNEHFVCIKIDREERPDLDHLYMEAVQMMNGGQGGWPLNVFCLPDGRPFAGGTYFPPDESKGHGIVPWPQLIMRVSDYFRSNRADLEENAVSIMKNLEAGNTPVQFTGDPLPPEKLLAAAESILAAHDDEFGGFGRAPKFPPAMSLDFLLTLRGSAAVEEQRPTMARRIDEVINTTLTAMAHGGLFDQVGGGFARYCVDREWIIPHFEKMLYDNGLLLGTYSRAFRRFPKPLYAAVVRETVAWLEREMVAPDGGFFSALDADSGGGEGLFYTWTPAEIEAVLGAEKAPGFSELYGITEAGNFEGGRSQPVLLDPDIAVRDQWAPARRALLAARAERPRPGRDEKRLVAWNCLVISGLAEAAWTFGESSWLERARETLDWIWTELTTGEGADLQLARGAYAEGAFGVGTLDDYAGLAEACLAVAAVVDWIEPGASRTYRGRARQLLAVVETHFRDPHTVGFFFTDGRQGDVLQRKKEWFDNATPSGHSGLLHVLAALAVFEETYENEDALELLGSAYPGYVARAPQAVGHALDGLAQTALGVAHIQCRPGADLEALRKALVARPPRRTFLEVGGETALPEDFQLCVGRQCLEPTSDPVALAELL